MVKKLVSSILIIIMLSMAIPIEEISRVVAVGIQNIQKIAAEARIGTTTIDVTGLSPGAGTGHQHIYEVKYDNNNHWEECWICGYINGATKIRHSLATVGTGGCGRMDEPIHEYCTDARCGYKGPEQPKAPHTWPGTWTGTDGSQAMHYKRCTVCGSTLEDGHCINSNGERLGCITGKTGTCVECGYNYSVANHGILNTDHNSSMGKLDTIGYCEICRIKLADVSYRMEYIKATSATRIYYTITPISGVDIDIDENVGVDSCYGVDGYWNFQLENCYREGNTIKATVLCTTNNNAPTRVIDGHITFNSYSYNGVAQSYVHLGINISPDNFAPDKQNIEVNRKWNSWKL